MKEILKNLPNWAQTGVLVGAFLLGPELREFVDSASPEQVSRAQQIADVLDKELDKKDDMLLEQTETIKVLELEKAKRDIHAEYRAAALEQLQKEIVSLQRQKADLVSTFNAQKEETRPEPNSNDLIEDLLQHALKVQSSGNVIDDVNP